MVVRSRFQLRLIQSCSADQFIFQDGTSPYTTAYSPTFTINFVAPGQPTGAMKKRRIERELRGEQTPYGKQCSAGATSCHITGEIWDVSLRRQSARVCACVRADPRRPSALTLRPISNVSFRTPTPALLGRRALTLFNA